MRRPYLAGGLAVLLLLVVTLPLFAEFVEPGFTAWNVVLGLILLAVAAGAILLARFFASHAGEIGEARFDTTSKSDVHG